MGAIDAALSELKFRIPPPVLRNAFMERTFAWRNVPVTIDEQVLNKVIRPRILTQSMRVGGSQVNISLIGVNYEMIDQMTAVYYIPKDRTDGRTITSIESVGYINYANAYNVASVGYVSPSAVNETMTAAAALMHSHMSIPPTSTARVQLIGENTIMVKDVNRVLENNFARVTIADDPNLNHLKPGTYMAFSKLVELAVKAYIYNELYIAVDKGFLDGGVDLNTFKETIDKYSDAEEMYQEFYDTKWKKILRMNDSERMTRIVKMLTGGMK